LRGLKRRGGGVMGVLRRMRMRLLDVGMVWAMLVDGISGVFYE